MKRMLFILAMSAMLCSCGKDGSQGPQGVPGTPGSPGAPGMPGTPGAAVTPVVPCPTKAGAYPEVLLCIDSALYAVLVESDPHDTRYVLVPPGTYETSDDRQCYFTVTSGCTLTNEH